MPFKTGLEGEEVILGRYTPTIDSMALLMDTKRFSFKNIAKDVFKTANPIEKAMQTHEFLGHFELTKRSPIWAWLFYYNFCTYLNFVSVIKMVEKGVVNNRLDLFRRYMVDLLFIEETINMLRNMWRPVQETNGNIFLLASKKQIKDSKIRDKFELLIKYNTAKSEIIRDLTIASEHILDEIDIKNGYLLLYNLSILASSISYKYDYRNPKDPKELEIMKREDYRYGGQLAKEDPAMIDPTLRFIEMIRMTTKLIPEIKKAISRGIDISNLAFHIAVLLGHKIDSIEETTKKLVGFFESISSNEKFPKMRRRSFGESEKMMRIFLEIIKQRAPTFWFLNDIDSENIYFVKGNIAQKYPGELEHYLHYSVLKYQFLKSMERDKNFIGCFENKLSICRSKCNSCLMNKGFKLTKKLYKTTSNLYSYDELVKEAMESRDAGSAIFK